MSLDKVGCSIVALVATMLMLIGLAYLLVPVEVLSITGQFNLDGDALIDVRATYGGFQVGLGLFLFVQIFRRENIAFSLLLLAIIFISVGSVRFVTSFVEVHVSYPHLIAGGVEIASAAACLFLSISIANERR
ncbi:DUF4345 family protein [uncultured Zhongshania sp.]|uniref:DUF4345 family protein n=1 Tax=uncultured Zhongshania sp. TaxID=1642288 RepID=UPI0030D891C4|tara:strand:- start:851 stop:1249 length:399 start_codon:yes stop_codon:yes gene_type:complete